MGRTGQPSRHILRPCRAPAVAADHQSSARPSPRAQAGSPILRPTCSPSGDHLWQRQTISHATFVHEGVGLQNPSPPPPLMIGTVRSDAPPRTAELIIAVSGLVRKTQQQRPTGTANGGLFACGQREGLRTTTAGSLAGAVARLATTEMSLKFNPVVLQQSC